MFNTPLQLISFKTSIKLMLNIHSRGLLQAASR